MSKHIELAEPRFTGKRYLMGAHVQEAYSSGSYGDTTIVDLGLKTWVEGGLTQSGNTWTLLQPEGSIITITNTHGGDLSLQSAPKPQRWL
jgi:hypothetical protein